MIKKALGKDSNLVNFEKLPSKDKKIFLLDLFNCFKSKHHPIRIYSSRILSIYMKLNKNQLDDIIERLENIVLKSKYDIEIESALETLGNYIEENFIAKIYKIMNMLFKGFIRKE